MVRELTGANVLLLVRDRIANDIPSLCREFGFRISASYYVEEQIRSMVLRSCTND
jgi:hypothetical protein